MQTIKTVIVIGLLLTVCYGAYVAMNAPDVAVPDDLKEWAERTGNDVLPDFNIPPITSSDAFDTDLPVAALPSLDSNVGGQAGSSLPMFPTLPSGGANDILGVPKAASNPADSNQSSALASTAPFTSSNSSAASLSQPQMSSLAVPSLPTLPTQQPATLNSNQSSESAPSGPAIAFNADLPGQGLGAPTTANSATANAGTAGDVVGQGATANDLIQAGDSFGASIPLLDPDAGSDVAKNLVSTNAASLDDATHSAPPGDTKPATPRVAFATARSEALQLASQGKLLEALEMLSAYYESPELNYKEHSDLVDILDALSKEVIYSDRHFLLPAYTVSAQDSLQSLAAKFSVNAELLAALNRMGTTTALVPNTQLKVLEGPFHAQISLNRGELTLFLKKLYAGRFPVSISQKNKPPLARYEIVDRRQDRTYYGANLRIPSGDPTNPYGGFWMSLGADYSIHGSAEQVTSDLEGAGCISLAPLDAADVYRILTKGAAVEIKP